jgi:hypothetical protein
MSESIKQNPTQKYINPIPQNYIPQNYIPQNYNNTSSWSSSSIVFFIILIILVSITFQYVIYRINDYYKKRIIHDWWNKRGGSKYNDCFNVDLIQSYSSNNILYFINTLFQTKQETLLTYKHIKFLDDSVMDHIYLKSDSGKLNKDKKYNFLWPRHMCESILFEKGEDYSYDNYLNGGGAPYPGNDAEKWRLLISKWCGTDSKPTWVTTSNTTNVKVLTFKGDTNKIEWFTDKHPDNIFARYRITYDSPIIYSLCNNNYTAAPGGVRFSRSAVLSLIGVKSGSGGKLVKGGGWVGFLLNLGDHDDPSDFVFTDLTIASDYGKSGGAGGGKKCEASDVGASVASGLGAALSIGLMIALAPETGGLSVVIGGIITGAVAMGGAAAAHGCLDNIL